MAYDISMDLVGMLMLTVSYYVNLLIFFNAENIVVSDCTAC